jgi:acyl-CoA thioesterase
MPAVMTMKALAESLSTMSGLEVLKAMTALEYGPPSIGGLMGMRYDEVEFGRVVFSLTTGPDFANPLGSVHGGVCATLLDSVMGCAVHSTLEAGVGFGTLELKVNYIRTVPTDGRRLTATGTIIHIGRTTATAEGRVVDEEGRLVAHATTTCMIHR